MEDFNYSIRYLWLITNYLNKCSRSLRNIHLKQVAFVSGKVFSAYETTDLPLLMPVLLD